MECWTPKVVGFWRTLNKRPTDTNSMHEPPTEKTTRNLRKQSYEFVTCSINKPAKKKQLRQRLPHLKKKNNYPTLKIYIYIYYIYIPHLKKQKKKKRHPTSKATKKGLPTAVGTVPRSRDDDWDVWPYRRQGDCLDPASVWVAFSDVLKRPKPLLLVWLKVFFGLFWCYVLKIYSC